MSNKQNEPVQMIDIFDREVSNLSEDFDLVDIGIDPKSKAFNIATSTEANECDFLRFLANVSNPFWNTHGDLRKLNTYLNYYYTVLSFKEMDVWSQHWVSKMCAIGYLLTKQKSREEPWAVIAIDDVSGSGRTGKCILSTMLSSVAKAEYKYLCRNLCEERFAWSHVDLSTRFCILDDFDCENSFEFLFSCLTGDMFIERQMQEPFIIPFEQSPKFYIPTGKFAKPSGLSFKERQWIISFSDYYVGYPPVIDFDHLLFHDWDMKQWTLFWRLMLDCVRCYQKFGRVQAPGY